MLNPPSEEKSLELSSRRISWLLPSAWWPSNQYPYFFFEAFFLAAFFFAFFAAITSHPLCRPRSVFGQVYAAKPVPGKGIVLRIVCVLSSDPRFCGVNLTRSQFDATCRSSRRIPATTP